MWEREKKNKNVVKICWRKKKWVSFPFLKQVFLLHFVWKCVAWIRLTHDQMGRISTHIYKREGELSFVLMTLPRLFMIDNSLLTKVWFITFSITHCSCCILRIALGWSYRDDGRIFVFFKRKKNNSEKKKLIRIIIPSTFT